MKNCDCGKPREHLYLPPDHPNWPCVIPALQPPKEAPALDPLEGVPFVAIGAGERAPWADLPLTCPTCGEGPLPLQESVGGGSLVLSFIKHCEGTWLRGELGVRA